MEDIIGVIFGWMLGKRLGERLFKEESPEQIQARKQIEQAAKRDRQAQAQVVRDRNRAHRASILAHRRAHFWCLSFLAHTHDDGTSLRYMP